MSVQPASSLLVYNFSINTSHFAGPPCTRAQGKPKCEDDDVKPTCEDGSMPKGLRFNDHCTTIVGPVFIESSSSSGPGGRGGKGGKGGKGQGGRGGGRGGRGGRDDAR